MLPPPDLREPRKSRVLSIVLTAVYGVLLAGGSCFGFLGWLNINCRGKPINAACAVGFVIGVAASLASIVWAIAAFVRYLRQTNKEQP